MIGQDSHFSLGHNLWGLWCHGLILGQALRDSWHIIEVVTSHDNRLRSLLNIMCTEGDLRHFLTYLWCAILIIAHLVDIYLCFNAQDKRTLADWILIIVDDSRLLTRLHILIILLWVYKSLLVYNWIHVEEIKESLRDSTLNRIYSKVYYIFHQSCSVLLLAVNYLRANFID